MIKVAIQPRKQHNHLRVVRWFAIPHNHLRVVRWFAIPLLVMLLFFVGVRVYRDWQIDVMR
jgi:hypothetical protein